MCAHVLAKYYLSSLSLQQFAASIVVCSVCLVLLIVDCWLMCFFHSQISQLIYISTTLISAQPNENLDEPQSNIVNNV